MTSDSDGHVLRSADGSDHHVRFSHTQVSALIATGAMTFEPGYFSVSGAMHQQAPRAMLLSELTICRLENFQRRVDTVERFREGYRQGAFKRSRSGYARAALALAEAQHRDALEAYDRQVAACEQERKEEEETKSLLRSSGSRRGISRHDAKRPSVEFPTRPVRRAAVSGRTLAEWVGRYELGGCDPLSLIDKYSNCGRGSKLDPRVEEIIRETINSVFLTETRPSMRYCHAMLDLAITKANAERTGDGMAVLQTPSYSALSERANRVPAFTQVRAREGQERAAAKFAISSGGARARFPMQRVETDEWTTHVHLIDGRPVPKAELKHLQGRDYERVRLVVAVVIDCATRYVLGVSVASTASSDNVKNALRMALSERDGLARAVGATSTWGPPAGLMEIFSDTGPSFDVTYRAAVMELGGTLVYGPAKKSGLRPMIERFFRTVDQRCLQPFTGRTFSNTQEAGSYPADKRASLTVESFREILLIYIIEFYHNIPHDGLKGQTPHEAWHEAIREFELPMPPDRNRLRANLGIRYRRRISGEGVYFANIPYTSTALQNYRFRKGNEVVDIAVDCSDINHISAFFDGKWQTLKSPTDKLQGVPLITWQSASNDIRRSYAAQAVKSRHIVLQALERIHRTSRSAVIAAELGAIRPSDDEIRRDEGKLRIAWTDPQGQAPDGTIADDDLRRAGEFFPFIGGAPTSGEDHRTLSKPEAPQSEESEGDGEESSWLWEQDE